MLVRIQKNNLHIVNNYVSPCTKTRARFLHLACNSLKALMHIWQISAIMYKTLSPHYKWKYSKRPRCWSSIKSHQFYSPVCVWNFISLDERQVEFIFKWAEVRPHRQYLWNIHRRHDMKRVNKQHTHTSVILEWGLPR